MQQRSRNGARRGTGTRLAALSVAAFLLVAIGIQPAHASVRVTIQSQPMAINAPIVGMAATPSGLGYWRVAADGGVLTAGDAQFYGSAAHVPHDWIVAIVSTRTGHGYWLVDRKGAVFNFGDAGFHGSMAGHALTRPIVGMARTPAGTGYWLVASDGGIFAFHAPFYGSTGAIRLNRPIVGMAAAPSGRGYTLVASDGGLFRFGAASPFFGSAANACPGAPAVAVATSPGAVGYWIAFADARTYAFSPATHPPTCAPSVATKTGQMENDLLIRVNQERAARGLPGLTWDPSLASYARAWSANMAANGFRHSQIANLLGPYDFVGENIAAGSAGTYEGSLHNAWMHSDGHRANILHPGFTRLGIGVFCKADGSIWMTEDFGRPTSAGPTQTSVPLPPVLPIVRPDSGTLRC